jgi:putative ABC transport system permease protein
VTFCMVLLVAAGLFVRSARSAQSLDLGMDIADVHEVRIDPPANEDEAARAARLAIDLPDLLRRDGVRDAAFVQGQPFAVEGAGVRAPGEDSARSVPTLRVSPEYFAVMRYTIVAGRAHAADAAGAGEVMVNALFAERRLGGVTQAVGATLTMDSVPRTVVGVVQDAQDVGDVRAMQEALYRPFDWSVAPRVLVRGTPESAVALASAIRDRDPSLQVSTRTYRWYVENQLSGATGAAAMAGVLGILALVLASVGIFGVFSFWVRQRTRDIGIRMAFGATTRTVLRMVLGATGRAVGWGMVLGIAASVAVALVLRSSLYGLQPLDPVAFGAAIGVLIVSAILATVIPAWRAIHVDPMEALRSE